MHLLIPQDAVHRLYAIALLADSSTAGACPLALYLSVSLGCDAEQICCAIDPASKRSLHDEMALLCCQLLCPQCSLTLLMALELQEDSEGKADDTLEWGDEGPAWQVR